MEQRLRQHGRTPGRGPAAPDDPASARQRQLVLHRGEPAGSLPREENTDAGINYDSLVLLTEVVTTQVALNTRENADTAAYSKDIDKFFLKKAGQLDETATDLLRDPQPACRLSAGPACGTDPAGSGPRWPVPVNPVTREHIEAALKNAKLLNYSSPSAPIFPFAPVDLGELKMCETLRETRGLSLPDLIRRWQASEEYARSSLRTFLINTYGEDSFPRPADLRAELARTLSLIAARLGSDWTPPDDLKPGQQPERAG